MTSVLVYVVVCSCVCPLLIRLMWCVYDAHALVVIDIILVLWLD